MTVLKKLLKQSSTDKIHLGCHVEILSSRLKGFGEKKLLILIIGNVKQKIPNKYIYVGGGYMCVYIYVQISNRIPVDPLDAIPKLFCSLFENSVFLV